MALLIPNIGNNGNDNPEVSKKDPPVINPPRAGGPILVVFGPRNPADDPTLGPNTIFTHKAVLPLTPQTMQIAAGANWTDALYAVEGDERGVFGGSMLDTITFSGRLEPPAYYIQRNRIETLQAAAGGTWKLAQQQSPSGKDLQAVLGPNGRYYWSRDGVLGNEIKVSDPFVGDLYPGSNLVGSWPGASTDVVVQPGGVNPSGYYWYEPHEFSHKLKDACKSGEVIRLVMGDHYGYNALATIRTYNWRYEDPDPDVINFDISLRQHRPRFLSTGPVQHSNKQPHGTYTTRDGDTLHKIAAKEFGQAASWTKIVQYNIRMLELLWVRHDTAATAAKGYSPALESVGPYDEQTQDDVAAHTPPVPHKVGNIAKIGDGIHAMTYLRNGIRLALAPPAPPKATNDKSHARASTGSSKISR